MNSKLLHTGGCLVLALFLAVQTHAAPPALYRSVEICVKGGGVSSPVEIAQEEVENLISSLAQEQLSPEQLSEADIQKKIGLILAAYSEPLNAVPESLLTDENIDWYLDSVRFELAEDVPLASLIGRSEEALHSIKNKMPNVSKKSFELIDKEKIKREDIERIRSRLPDFADMAAEAVIEHFRSADVVYLDKYASVDGKRVENFLPELVEPLIAPSQYVTEHVPVRSEARFRKKRDELTPVIGGIYLEEQLRYGCMLSAKAAQFKLQSLFNLPWFFGDQIPDTIAMDQATRERLASELDSSLGSDTIIVGQRFLSFYASQVGYIALSAALGPGIKRAVVHKSSSTATPEKNPDQYIKLRFPDISGKPPSKADPSP